MKGGSSKPYFEEDGVVFSTDVLPGDKPEPGLRGEAHAGDIGPGSPNKASNVEDAILGPSEGASGKKGKR